EALGVAALAEALPEGLDTLGGAGGLGCSGGEIQRVALARCWMSEAALWLMDEPTARLDRDAETAVLEALGRVAGRHTVIIATHAPAVIAAADTVARLEPARKVAA
ncbi:MAG: ATP-binding cassette domain-containing protein, partial [Maricaulaceae bacterium]